MPEQPPERQLEGDRPIEAPVNETVIEQQPSGPIVEDENSVSYLGVKLEKAHIPSAFIPSRESYAGEKYIQDQFSLELQQKIATSFLQNEPLLLEGGTSLGKTTTVRKMAAELGWEVHYLNLVGESDVDNLMGKYIPNAHRERIDDPEFVFADGKVTSGLRIEEGKKKIILIDEINASKANILIRLHEVLDALERNGEVVLSEDASESVPVNKDQTKIVGLMNPPGKGYSGREPLDPAQLRRWNYQKEASNLPDETFSLSTDVLFGLAVEAKAIPQETYLKTQEQRLVPDQLKEIPGIVEVLGKYKEFHKAAKELVRNRSVAADQPQKFTYDDRMEPRRVKEFVQQFYSGDINETFQKALRYYYSNKLESKTDKQKLEEIISHVSYSPPVESRRRELGEVRDNPEASALEARAKKEIADLLASPEIPESVKAALSAKETSLSGELLEQIAEAKTIFGQDLIGPEEIKAALGLEAGVVPKIPFSKEALERAQELGQMLILRLPVTMAQISETLKGKLKDGTKLLNSTDESTGLLKDSTWYKDQDFYAKELARSGWALVSKEVVPNSTSHNYLAQTEVLVSYIQNEVFKGKVLPAEYAEAIKEFNDLLAADPDFATKVESTIESVWKEAAAQLAGLKISQIARQSPVEVMYDTVAFFQTNSDRILENTWSWTNQRSSAGRLVSVGHFDPEGLDVCGARPGYAHDALGVSFSRNL